MSIDKKISYKDQRLTKTQQKKTKPANQGGGPNYLGKQKKVTVPKKWLSSPDHVVAELAYITPREQKILLDADLYGSLNGQPNRGPGGIMSLQGDMGSVGGGPSGGGGGGGGRDRDPPSRPSRPPSKPAPSKPGPAPDRPGGQDASKPDFGKPGPAPDRPGDGYIDPGFIEAIEEITKGTLSDPEEKLDFVGDTIFGPTQEYTGDSSLFGGANKYGYTDQYTDPTKTNFGDTKPGYGGKIFGGLFGLATGIPFIGSAIGNAYDKGKGLFTTQPQDMSKFNNLGLYTDRPQFTGKYGTPTQQGDYDIYGNKINELTGEILDPVTGEVIDIIPGYPNGPGSDDGGITTLPTGDGGSAQYVNLIDQYVPDDPIIPNDAFLQRFKVKDEFRKAKGDDLIAEDKRIAEYIKNLYT